MADSASRKKNHLHTVRRLKAMDAPHWPQRENPYHADVVSRPSRIAEIVEGAEIHGVKDMKPEGGCLPGDMGPVPDKVFPGVEVSEAAFETWGCSSPK